MALIAKDTGGGGDFEPAPQGTHLAICNMIVDLGLQETTYLGNPSIKHQVYVRWELPKKRMGWKDQDGTDREGPVVIGKTYTLSLNEKANLRKDLESWRGRTFTPAELEGFDLMKVLGASCQVTVTHKPKDGGGVYANVTSVAGWPDGMPSPDKVECDLLKYSDDETADFEKLPQWLRDKVMKQKRPDEFQGGPGYQNGDPGAQSTAEYGTAHDDFGDSVPF